MYVCGGEGYNSYKASVHGGGKEASYAMEMGTEVWEIWIAQADWSFVELYSFPIFINRH